MGREWSKFAIPTLQKDLVNVVFQPSALWLALQLPPHPQDDFLLSRGRGWDIRTESHLLLSDGGLRSICRAYTIISDNDYTHAN